MRALLVQELQLQTVDLVYCLRLVVLPFAHIGGVPLDPVVTLLIDVLKVLEMLVVLAVGLSSIEVMLRVRVQVVSLELVVVFLAASVVVGEAFLVFLFREDLTLERVD